MRIAVTGSAGRLGRAVVDLAVAQGHRVVGIDLPGHPGAPSVTASAVHRTADVRHYDQLRAAIDGCDALIHLAAHIRPGDQPDHVVHNDNVTGSFNALSAVAGSGIHRVCLASSVNAIGGAYSRRPRYDYFPVDEQHPTYSEDPYGLSKWVAEQQADAFARRYPDMAIGSLRIHGVKDVRPVTRCLPDPARFDLDARHLWGYVLLAAAAAACLQTLRAPFSGHEVFYIAAPDTSVDVASESLRRGFYPQVPVRDELVGNQGFFNCGKAQRVLGWRHP
jgi:UDP-glucose 4-epimerase